MITSYRDSYAPGRTQNGQVIKSLDPITRANLYKRTVRMLGTDYTPLRQPDAGITDLVTRTFGTETAYFYEETPPRDIGAGMVELDEFYAAIPVQYIEPGIESYSYQWYRPTWGGGDIVESTRSVSSSVVHTFGLMGNDGTLAVGMERHIAPKILNWPNSALNEIPTWVGEWTYVGPFTGQSVLLARDSDIHRHRGPIAERINIFVPKLTPYHIEIPT